MSLKTLSNQLVSKWAWVLKPREISRRDLAVFNMAGSKLVLEGRISIISFISGLGVIIIPLLVKFGSHIDWIFDYLTDVNGKIAIAAYITVVNGFLLLIYKGPLYKVRLKEKVWRMCVIQIEQLLCNCNPCYIHIHILNE